MELTYQKVMAMSASEIRALADSHEIDAKEEGKFIKVSELRKRVMTYLELI
jgi:hypothetical protein